MALDFQSLPFAVLVAAFLGAAALVWISGTRLAGYVSAFADQTGLSGPVAGMLLLGVITSSPEVATGGTAAWRGDVHLAAGDILGSISLQVVVIAIADAAIGKRALTSSLPSPALLLQANMGVILLVLTAVGVIVGDVAFLGIGAWPLALAILYLATPFLILAAERREGVPSRAAAVEVRERSRSPESGGDRGVAGLALRMAAAGAVIFVAGFVLSGAGGQIAARTGLGSSFFGLVFLAAATSLPELSSALGAARLNRADLAVGDILGSNMINLALLLMIDGLYRGPPVFNELRVGAAVSALLAAVLTLIFMMGLIERRNRSLLRMGYDSIAVLVVYAAGLGLLYQLR